MNRTHPVIDWLVQDLPNEGDRRHRTEWRAEYKDHILVIRREQSEFECWVEREGDAGQLRHTRYIQTLTQAKTTVLDAIVVLLDVRTLQADEQDAVRLPLVCDLEEAYETAARRAGECGLHGQALKFKLEAETLRAEGDAIRRRAFARAQVARSLPVVTTVRG